MSNYQLWQLNTYGNILPEDQEPKEEEYEYLNIENKEACEWLEKQVENELLDHNKI